MTDPTAGRPSGEETSEAVRDVLKDQAAREERRREPAAPRRSGPPVWVVPLLGLIAVVVIAYPPAFLRPEPVPPPTPEEVSTGLRMDLSIVAGQIELFQSVNRELPESLLEVLTEPEKAEGMTYRPLGDGIFELRGTRGTEALVYRSDEPVGDFLRPALERVMGGT